MADAITAAIGAVIMMGYIYFVAEKINELPLTIASIIGIVLMLLAFWTDAWKPLLKRNSN